MRLLIATDGSASADRTVDLALQPGWGAGLTVRVVTVLDAAAMAVATPWPIVSIPVIASLDDEARAAAEGTLADAVARLSGHVTVESALLHGRAAPTIAAEAKQWHADAILIGNRGHSALATMLLGSVSAEVIDLADRPVLVTRAGSIDAVVLGADGSTGAAHAVDLVLRWPVFEGVPIRVVAVAPSAYPWWVGMAEAGSASVLPQYGATESTVRDEETAIVKDVVDRLTAAGRQATGEVREGDAADQLIAAGRATSSDLIVTGTHGRTGLKRLILGSVARNVLLHASSSVLIVREVPDDPQAGVGRR